MMNTEPGWVKENKLAVSLGWTPLKDPRRNPGEEYYWCMFKKFDLTVWQGPSLKWIRAEYHDGGYRNHKRFDTLEEAL